MICFAYRWLAVVKCVCVDSLRGSPGGTAPPGSPAPHPASGPPRSPPAGRSIYRRAAPPPSRGGVSASPRPTNPNPNPIVHSPIPYQAPPSSRLLLCSGTRTDIQTYIYTHLKHNPCELDCVWLYIRSTDVLMSVCLSVYLCVQSPVASLRCAHRRSRPFVRPPSPPAPRPGSHTYIPRGNLPRHDPHHPHPHPSLLMPVCIRSKRSITLFALRETPTGAVQST